jgi:hypothetical protein
MRCSRWMVVALAAVGLGACERTSEAQARKDSKPPVVKPAPGEDPAVFQGTVTVVGDNQFIVRGRNGLEEPFEINDKTDFIHNGEAVERKELQEGKHVRTRYDQQAGKKVADEVEIY